ncbi:cytochrome c oxidase subunit 3 family protein [Marinobacterium jannaschii]|uniref:cytochrome c oxidase subunit 3 family protein n=1 Tax=Marinobacterium jannaschii TaxID=64970 RepID=UPI00068577A1|nr:cytochrome c oxidase subunit 3 family protein [Marinobacterium jannaschii]
MWLFILAELSVFALFFLLFSALRRYDPETFNAGQQLLHPVAGLVNTLVLLTSSGCVAEAIVRLRQHRPGALGWWLLSIPVGALYIPIKLWEYKQLVAAGHDLDSNAFFTGYFLLTGFHLLHVVLGLVILLFVALRIKQGAYRQGQISGAESSACYWHMVDLVWVILFPLIYVIH